MALKEADFSHAYYLDNFIRPDRLQESVKLAKIALKKIKPDAIAFRGSSGILIGAAIGYATGTPMILVRKPKEDCHSSHKVEGYRKAKTYIIVDDCIASGDTARAIQSAIQEFSPEAKCLGVLSFITLTKRRAKEGHLDTYWMKK